MGPGRGGSIGSGSPFADRTMTQVFYNGTILTDSGPISHGMVVARLGRIEHVGPYDPRLIPADAEQIDAAGLYIAPGLVDIHIHGGAGSDFMDATAADVETVFRYHAAHGTTSLCPTTANGGRSWNAGPSRR